VTVQPYRRYLLLVTGGLLMCHQEIAASLRYPAYQNERSEK